MAAAGSLGYTPPVLAIPHTASESQRIAIEAEPQPLLVLAGPGAGKTFCLIERIRFLIENKGFDPARICAFTFTNKAAGEIASRLEKQFGPRAELIKRGTIHAFCAGLLREFGQHVGVEPGFGIADEDYQLLVLRRVEGYRKWHKRTLTQFAAHRFRADSLRANDRALYDAYRQYLERRNMLDFDMLVLKTAELLRVDSVAEEIRARWDCVLVDEFQDLNPVQYSIIRSLALGHRNIFAVGDDEQSIYSWAGADPQVFVDFVNDFKVSTKAQLGENRRCPSEVVALARRLLTVNTPIFTDRRHAEAEHDSPFPVAALTLMLSLVPISPRMSRMPPWPSIVMPAELTHTPLSGAIWLRQNVSRAKSVGRAPAVAQPVRGSGVMPIAPPRKDRTSRSTRTHTTPKF